MKTHKPLNILLVDDQPGKLMSYEAILADSGENLIKAHSAREALEHLLKKEFAVVLIDVCMPELDGFELASMVRSHPRLAETAIILVSSLLVEDVHRLKGYTSGAVDYVSVPIVPEILRAKVAIFTDLYRKTHELRRLNRQLEHRVAERTAEIEAAATRLRQSEERMRLVLTASGIRGWTWDIRENALTWVTAAGHSVREFKSPLAVLRLIHPADRAAIRSAYMQAVDGKSDYEAEFRLIEGGEVTSWLARGTVIRDPTGAPLSIAGININITDRKRTEDERAALLHAAEEARRQLEDANRVKDEFLAVLSHELRTPLNAITGWAHMLRSGGLDPATQTRAIEIIYRNSFLQAQLISDILDVSRIVSGKFRLELSTLDLSTVIHAALDMIRPAAEAKGIEIFVSHAPDAGPISGDQARLQQVVGNLLTNAVKFTPAGGSVQIITERAGDCVELTVQDDGPGIPPELLPHIFERFRQGDSSTTRSHQGLGLGLAIVKHLVEMHGGSVYAGGRTDCSGAVFKVILPAQFDATTERKTPVLSLEEGTWPEPGSILEGARILLVDDENDAREVVSLLFERWGAHVSTAGSVDEALRVLERATHDLVVADIGMPGKDGYALIRALRALPAERGGKTPAIALTAHAGGQDRMKILNAGFQMHVPKPVHAGELAAAVSTLIARAAAGHMQKSF